MIFVLVETLVEYLSGILWLGTSGIPDLADIFNLQKYQMHSSLPENDMCKIWMTLTHTFCGKLEWCSSIITRTAVKTSETQKPQPEESAEKAAWEQSGHFWMILSGSLAPQPNAQTCPFVCVTLISCKHVMRNEGICHHLQHCTDIELQPVMGPGIVMSQSTLKRECGRIFFPPL